MFYGVTSPLIAPTIFRYDVATRAFGVVRAGRPAFDPAPYETRQVFYTSKDGTRMPMFITGRKGLALDGSNPAMSLWVRRLRHQHHAASFRPTCPRGSRCGGVYARRAICAAAASTARPGTKPESREKAERVRRLHRRGRVPDREKYTSPSKLGDRGGSNGGLLVGAVMTQRPDLFAVALPAVGVLDMLRYDHFTGGSAWVAEYGRRETRTSSYLSVFAAAEREAGHVLSRRR